MNRMKLMLTIVDRGDGLALAKLYAQNGVQLHLQIAADGTATSELMDLLGLTHRERDLLVGFGDAAAVDALLNRLDDDDGYRGILRVRGIALSVPMTAVSHFLASALAVPAGSIAEGGAHHMSNDKEYSLILVTVNQGGTDRLMQTACAAGATGGTVIRGRWVGAQRLEQFHGVSLQDEKEAVLIACARDKRNDIMDAITQHHGAHTGEQALLCALPVDRLVKLL